MSEIITRFIGEYRFLSNFYESPVRLDSTEYATVEHAFQAAKTLDLKERVKILEADTPGKAKKLGRKVTLREDWEQVKMSIMEALVFHKFEENKALAAALVATGDAELIEGNNWGDEIWGMVVEADGALVGENLLGKILMKVRDQLKGRR